MAPNMSVIHFSRCCFTFPPCVVALVARVESELADDAASPLVPITENSAKTKNPMLLIYYFQLQFGCVLLPVVVNCF